MKDGKAFSQLIEEYGAEEEDEGEEEQDRRAKERRDEWRRPAFGRCG